MKVRRAFLPVGIFLMAGCGVGLNKVKESASNGAVSVQASGSNVSLSQSKATVPQGTIVEFTVTPESGHTLLTIVGGDCPKGEWNGNTYKTGLIQSSCSVDFKASTQPVTLTAYTSNATTDYAGTQVIELGTTLSYTVTTSEAYNLDSSVGGGCPAGSWVGNVYTTGAINADCNIVFSGVIKVYSVSSTANGLTRTPSAAQNVNHGSTQTFTVSEPEVGYSSERTVGGTCPVGSWSGNNYTTGAIYGACSVLFGSEKRVTLLPRDTGSGYVYDFTTDVAGNAYLTGNSSGQVGSAVAVGVSDGYVAKYSPSRSLLWATKVGLASAWTRAFAQAVDSSGNVYVGGDSDYDLETGASASQGRAFVAKLNAAGEVQWVRSFGGMDSDIVFGLATDSTGHVFVTGFTSTGLNGNTANSPRDLFIGKMSTAGNWVWVKQYGGGGTESHGLRVVTDTAGNAYVGGFTMAAINDNMQAQAGNEDLVVAKFDSLGNKQWIRQLGVSGGSSKVTTLTVSAQGVVYAAGETSVGLNGNSQTGRKDVFVASYSASGDLNWVAQRGSVVNREVYASSVGIDNSGNIVLAGTARLSPLTGAVQIGETDIYMLRYNSTGNFVSVRQYGGLYGRLRQGFVSLRSDGSSVWALQSASSLGGEPHVNGTDEVYLGWNLF